MSLGPLAPLTTTEVQAFIGLATFANQLSWLWPIINRAFAASMGVSLSRIKRFKSQLGIGAKLLS